MMDYISEYAVSIIVVSVLAVLLENILPGGSSKKYINVMIGLLVMLVILSPLTRLPHYSETFAVPELRLDDKDLSAAAPQSYIADNFQRNLALAISEDIYSSYNTAVNCRVACTVNEDGQITGVRRVQLEPYSAEIGTYVAQKYGFEEACVTP